MRVRLTAVAMVLVMTALTLMSAVAPASAAWPDSVRHAESPTTLPRLDDPNQIEFTGKLFDTRTSPPKPVPGVKVSVMDATGKVVGEARSDAQGTFTIPIGKPDIVLGKTFTVKIDTNTLPEGAALRDPKKVSVTYTIKIDTDISIRFPIGPDLNAPDPWYENAVRLLVSGIIFSLLLGLASLGLSMIFGTTGLTNFAHGELITFGALVAWGLESLGLPLIAAGALAVLVSGVFGWSQDLVLWRPLRRRGTGLIAMMIVSIGLGIFLRNVFQYLAGADNHNYSQYTTQDPHSFGWVLITDKEMVVAAVAAAVLAIVCLALQKTRTGKAMRAVADNPALASSSGINVDKVISFVWIGGAALAGLSGFLLGVNQGFDYQVGLKNLLLVFAAVTLGGLGTIWGALLGSLLVGLLIEESTLVIPAEMKLAAGLGVLIVVLLFRPQGLLGRAERIG
ncbi:MAG: ABC transporter permease subunit [Nocardioidaceae bacterium]